VGEDAYGRLDLAATAGPSPGAALRSWTALVTDERPGSLALAVC
jgi:hypothetical protein